MKRMHRKRGNRCGVAVARTGRMLAPHDPSRAHAPQYEPLVDALRVRLLELSRALAPLGDGIHPRVDRVAHRQIAHRLDHDLLLSRIRQCLGRKRLDRVCEVADRLRGGEHAADDRVLPFRVELLCDHVGDRALALRRGGGFIFITTAGAKGFGAAGARVADVERLLRRLVLIVLGPQREHAAHRAEKVGRS